MTVASAFRHCAARHPLWMLLCGSLLLALLSLLVLPLGAGYDPLSWSIWGDELARLALDTRAGPAFKPLPVLVIAPVAGVLGPDAGLAWWLVVARTGGLMAAGVGGLLAARLTREVLTRSSLADALVRARADDAPDVPDGDDVPDTPGRDVVPDVVGADDVPGRGPAGAPVPTAAGPPAAAPSAQTAKDAGPPAAAPSARTAQDVGPSARTDRLVLLAGVGAALSILLCARFAKHALLGVSEPLVGLAAAAAVLEHRSGRTGRSWAWAMVAALLRPETWLVVGPYGLWLLWRRPRLRVAVVLCGLALPVLWFGAEQWGSGDWQRSQAIANVPNPGQPALSAFPFGISLGGTLGIPPTPVLLAALVAPVLALRRRGLRTLARWPAAERDLLVLGGLGAGLVLLTAVMAELGYSGEGRYALPGLVLLMISGAVALARLARWLPERRARWSPRTRVASTALVVVAALLVVVRVPFVGVDAVRVDRQLESQRSLGRLVERLGGPAAVRACGAPVSGRYREPVLARALDTPIAGVARAVPPTGPTVLFAAPLNPGAPVSPTAGRPLRPVARAAPWRVAASCRPGTELAVAPPRADDRTGARPASVWVP